MTSADPYRGASHDGLIRALRERLPAKPPAPASPSSVASAEAELGFALPELLRRILCEVANGGFGPGNGLMGLPPDGFVDEDLSISPVEAYLSSRQEEEPYARTPEGLLAICGWGRGDGAMIFSYVDCLHPEATVVTAEHLGENEGYYQTAASLFEWLSEWAETGQVVSPIDLVGHLDVINPFTKSPQRLPRYHIKGALVDYGARL